MKVLDNPPKSFDSDPSGDRLEAGALPTSDAESCEAKASSGAVSIRQDPSESWIGAYRLLQKIGEGGMGQVWLADQTAPVKRKVALKLIRSGVYDDAVARRFKSEQQSLAIMDHPAIAKVLDAGSTENGQPYFVMEYVPGLPISQYCDEKKLSIPERIKLFIRVCEGVQHAHQKAIIHRDLKPSNILVVELDGKPVPRIIDFGIAKAITQQESDQTRSTRVGGPIGTPGYMSPEQADPNLGDVDTRTDVYSLGVILFELLTGSHPLNLARGQEQPFDPVLRQIREEDPPSPSTKLVREVSRQKETVTLTAEMRGTDPKQLVILLRGDLDWITMTAIERDRTRRYGTPSELAADLGRYLRSEPVVARPATAGYRLRKYLRRHRMGVGTATALALLLCVFAAMQTVELRRTRRERDRADRITKFMTKMFEVSDPSEARGKTITAREILDNSSKQIDAELAKDPELQAQMANVMGNVYEKLGLYSRAKPLLGKSAEIRRHILGPRHPETLRSMDDLAWLSYREGNYPEAEKLQWETLNNRRSVMGPLHRETAESAMHLAATLEGEGRFVDAEKLEQEAFEIAKRSLGPEHPFTLVTMSNLAGTLQLEGHYAEAKTLLAQTLAVERRSLGTDHPATLASMTDLAGTLIKMGEYAEAERLQRETRDIQRRVFGPDHPETAGSTYNLACLAARQGERDKALALLREAVDHGLAPNVLLAMEDDSDLQPLHGDSRFAMILEDAKRRAAAAQKVN